MIKNKTKQTLKLAKTSQMQCKECSLYNYHFGSQDLGKTCEEFLKGRFLNRVNE